MSIYEKLFDYQKSIVDNLKDKEGFGLFLDCGTGKTPVSLALAESHQADKILVITINSKAIETEKVDGSWLWWASQISIDNQPIKMLLNKKSKESFLSSHNSSILVANYESLFDRSSINQSSRTKRFNLSKYILDFISSARGHRVCLIIDESHKMKDPNSLQSKAITQIKALLKVVSLDFHYYLLTGTPFTQGFIDLYNQLKFLGCPMTKTEFKDRFCIMGHINGLLGWQQPIVGYKNIDELYKIIHQFALTVKADDVIKLPDKIIVEHKLATPQVMTYFSQAKLSGKEIAKYNSTREKLCLPSLTSETLLNYNNLKAKYINPWFKNIDYPEANYLCDTPSILYLRTRQLLIGFQGNAEQAEWYDLSRLNELEKFLINNPDNYILFYNYTPEFFVLFNLLNKLNYKIDVYNGSIKSTYFYDKYCKSSVGEKLITTKQVLLANFASGSTGMNWQGYNKCIVFSLPLYKDWEQGLKRIYRIGQTNTVTYHLFISDHWLDKKMYEALQNKTDYSLDMFNKDLNEFHT